MCATLPSLGDGRQIASEGNGGKMRLWDVESCLSIVEVKDRIQDVRKVTMGRTILSYSGRSTVQQWGTTTGESEPAPFTTPEFSTIASLSFSPGNWNQMAAGSGYMATRWWDCQTGTEGPVLEGHK